MSAGKVSYPHPATRCGSFLHQRESWSGDFVLCQKETTCVSLFRISLHQPVISLTGCLWHIWGPGCGSASVELALDSIVWKPKQWRTATGCTIVEDGWSVESWFTTDLTIDALQCWSSHSGSIQRQPNKPLGFNWSGNSTAMLVQEADERACAVLTCCKKWT